MYYLLLTPIQDDPSTEIRIITPQDKSRIFPVLTISYVVEKRIFCSATWLSRKYQWCSGDCKLWGRDLAQSTRPRCENLKHFVFIKFRAYLSNKSHARLPTAIFSISVIFVNFFLSIIRLVLRKLSQNISATRTSKVSVYIPGNWSTEGNH